MLLQRWQLTIETGCQQVKLILHSLAFINQTCICQKSLLFLFSLHESWVQHRWVGFSGLCSARGQPRSFLKTESSVMSSTARPSEKPMCVASLDALSCGAAQGPATLLKLVKPQTFIITSLNIMALGLPRKAIIW